MNREKFYTNRRNIVLLAALCCFLWGSAYPAIKGGYELFNISGEDIPSKLIFAGYRFALAGIIVLLVQIISKKNIFVLNKKEIVQVTLLGIFQTTLQYIFFYIGLAYTTGIRSSIINGTGAFFSILLAHFIYKNDRLNVNKIVGCIVGFIGVIIVNLNGQDFFASSFSIQGEGFVMLAAFILSASSIYGKKITQNQDASIITGYQLFIGGLILLLLGYISGGCLSGFTLKSTSLLIYMALLSSVAFAVWTQLLKYNKVGIISIFNFLVPVFGSLLSAIFLGENIFDIKILISLIFVCLGIYMVYKIK
ncbi:MULTISPECIES: DMT family transporter [Clostridium]|uniref:Exported membrane protein n=2 Tax=Clostridium butyricum TaxID=1492 RepID=C4IEA3_CLOBU|nr:MULTISPECIES: DMT family transporter [Clostridium]APF23680.1 eamA-like transporter family protein [Clostridium butyricum]EDT73933.1 exported membrane protein [Clostridium butyricum 5521]EEP55070.1 exported membrane protein [Clostridium butyricum E4 str. BoNT E BL5262]KHD14517.1 multidrug DMT transporter [Clostridium butyricum]MBS4841211.1 DMT family transporter [Clostridium sp.]